MFRDYFSGCSGGAFSFWVPVHCRGRLWIVELELDLVANSEFGFGDDALEFSGLMQLL
jgi:hypothetical protein